MTQPPPRPPARVDGSPPRIAILGSLADVDLALANAVVGAGLPVVVLRDADQPGLYRANAVLFPRLEETHLSRFTSKAELLRLLRTFDVVFTFTSALGDRLGRRVYLYPLLRRLGWPPYIDMATGSDVNERALELTRPGRIQRFCMRHAFVQGLPPFPDAIRTAVAMRLSNVAM